MEVTVLGKGVRRWAICHLRKTISFPRAKNPILTTISPSALKAVGDCKPSAGNFRSTTPLWTAEQFGLVRKKDEKNNGNPEGVSRAPAGLPPRKWRGALGLGWVEAGNNRGLLWLAVVR